MKKITEVLRLRYETKLSLNKVALACGLSKGVVSKYISLAKSKGVIWPLEQGVDEAKLEALLFPVKAPAHQRFSQPDYFQVHQELKTKGVTLYLLWAEYAANHLEQAYQYSQYCHHYKQWRAKQKRSMRQTHLAGEKLFIDYCGPTVNIIDPGSGEIRSAQIFVSVLGASSYTYAEAGWTQSLPDWIASHQRALRFYGGVTQLLIPDNLKSAVTKASRYAPRINETYAEMAAHYQTAILPARPYKPKDKAKAEAGVLLVERWILARLRHHTFFSLAELNKQIRALLTDLNARPFQGREESRKSLFESIDKPALKALPQDDYIFARWCRAKPGIDYHVQIDKRYYSVPHALVGEVLDVRVTAISVEVMHKGKRVACHTKLSQSNVRHSTLTEHMPKSHQAHRNWSPSRFINWARKIGPCTAEVIKRQLENRPHPEHGYRACLGLLNLARRYEGARLESACKRALLIRSTSYTSITSILKTGLDQQPLENEQEQALQKDLPLHSNLRGANYYH
jgi:transposase